MKKISLVIILASSVLLACSQKIDPSKVPAATKSSFEKNYPGIKGSWELEEGNYEVSFKQNGKESSCVIDANGKIRETETGINVSELPVTARTYIQKNFPSAKIKEAAKIVKTSGETIFEAEVNKQDLLFSESGDYLSGKKEN